MVLRTTRPAVSVRVAGRSLAVSAVLLFTLVALVVTTLSTGDYPVPPGDVVLALLGAGDPWADFVVNTLRLPRVLTAVFVGAALGASGAIMQSLTRNPLGSPDVVGFTNGSATGALIVIIVLHGSMAAIALGALAGGLLTAAAVYLLAFRRGVQGFRFILVGIGVSAMLLAVNSYLITRASWQDGLAAQAWQIGTLNSRGWDEAITVGLVLAALSPVALAYARALALLEMGDAAATGLGVPVERARLVLITVSVTLCAVATAAAGPIAFVALAAPQLARRLCRSAAPGLVSAALLGAVLLTGGDLAVQRIFAPHQLPVGVVTGALGGLYLLWLLTRQWRQAVP
jgi:iron complex transport system permease protein